MPSKTLEDKVDDLTKLGSTLAQQVQTLEGRFSSAGTERAETIREVGSCGKSIAVIEQQLRDLRSWKDGFGSVDQIKIDLAIIRKELDELKKWQDEVKKQKDEWGRRFWGLISSIIVALVGLAVGYYLRPK